MLSTTYITPPNKSNEKSNNFYPNKSTLFFVLNKRFFYARGVSLLSQSGRAGAVVISAVILRGSLMATSCKHRMGNCHYAIQKVDEVKRGRRCRICNYGNDTPPVQSGIIVQYPNNGVTPNGQCTNESILRIGTMMMFTGWAGKHS
jgi:hypothetical protein